MPVSTFLECNLRYNSLIPQRKACMLVSEHTLPTYHGFGCRNEQISAFSFFLSSFIFWSEVYIFVYFLDYLLLSLQILCSLYTMGILFYLQCTLFMHIVCLLCLDDLICWINIESLIQEALEHRKTKWHGNQESWIWFAKAITKIRMETFGWNNRGERTEISPAWLSCFKSVADVCFWDISKEWISGLVVYSTGVLRQTYNESQRPI